MIRTMSACNQLCIYAAVCDWFDRYNRDEGPELSTADLTNLTHREDLTASRKDCVTTKNIAKPLLKCDKKQVFQHQLDKANTSRPDLRSTRVCRE